MKKYPKEIEEQMKKYYQTLSEKDRRRYAAIEAIKLDYGGKGYICKLFGCDYKTITKGVEELKSQVALETKKIRQSGGGPKKAIEKYEGLENAFKKVLKEHTAGSPMDESIKWTNLTQKQIAEKLQELGFPVGVKVIKNLLEKHGFRKRKASKVKTAGESKNRDEQFQKIDWLKQVYNQKGNPVVSMDTKKKNL